MPQHTDPLASITEETPTLSEAAAISIVREQYGLDVSVRPLVSERDQNFEMRAADGQRYVLKIASSAEEKAVTHFQVEALLHIAKYLKGNKSPLSVPKVLLTRSGETHTMIDVDGRSHVARVVSYVDGVPVGERVPSGLLCRNMGRYLAYLQKALRGFSHPGSQQLLLWDVQQALQLRELITHIPKDGVRADVKRSLDEFEKFAWPELPSLRRQVIHSDFNPDNVLIQATRSDVVAGVIDFGDMLEAPLIVDVAIAASYLRPSEGDPLALIAEFLAGYASVTSLQSIELKILFELIRARLCASIVILYWRASFRDANDPYLSKLLDAESFAETFLSRLNLIPRGNARQAFEQVCASTKLQ
ncbi:MAG: phosphotransferase [Woeseiaceae bacterium]